MGIRFLCPKCEKKLNVKVSQAGKRGICPRCESRFRIPLSYNEGDPVRHAEQSPKVSSTKDDPDDPPLPPDNTSTSDEIPSLDSMAVSFEPISTTQTTAVESAAPVTAEPVTSHVASAEPAAASPLEDDAFFQQFENQSVASPFANFVEHEKRTLPQYKNNRNKQNKVMALVLGLLSMITLVMIIIFFVKSNSPE